MQRFRDIGGISELEKAKEDPAVVGDVRFEVGGIGKALRAPSRSLLQYVPVSAFEKFRLTVFASSM